MILVFNIYLFLFYFVHLIVLCFKFSFLSQMTTKGEKIKVSAAKVTLSITVSLILCNTLSFAFHTEGKTVLCTDLLGVLIHMIRKEGSKYLFSTAVVTAVIHLILKSIQ